jgi:SAM-dependent methyltransferase
MVTLEMLSDMCCPVCRSGELKADIVRQENGKIIEAELVCSLKGESYSVRSGVANFIPPSLMSDAQWQMWQDHLLGFQARREERIREPHRRVHAFGKKARSRHAKSKFAEFAGIREGKVLDLGCGPGKFRLHLNENIEYYGIDPLPLPEVAEFPFVCALSEYIPFKDGTFSHIVVIDAMDHFKDLEAFFKEALRILKHSGKLHLIQAVHDMKGPVSAVKVFTHWVKDSLEDRATKIKNSETPKHIIEFTSASLREFMNRYFTIDAIRSYNEKWYSPTKLFLNMSPR